MCSWARCGGIARVPADKYPGSRARSRHAACFWYAAMRTRQAHVIRGGAASAPPIETVIADLEAVLARGRAQLEALRNPARGTRDLKLVPPDPEPAAEKPAIEKSQTLRTRVEIKLRAASMTLQQLARDLAEPAGSVSAVLRALKTERMIANVGLADHPIWTLRVGDDTGTPELIAVVQRLLRERPMTTREVADATGARLSRVEGAIVAIRRSDAKVLDLGHSGARRWLVVPADARDAHLEPKRRPQAPARAPAND